MTDLAREACEACRGGVPPLTPAAAAALLQETPLWAFAEDGTRIERAFRFADFAAALAFIVHVGAIAEGAGHHPDISFGWGYARISLHTHAIGGLQRADFVLAAKIDRIAPPPGSR